MVAPNPSADTDEDRGDEWVEVDQYQLLPGNTMLCELMDGNFLLLNNDEWYRMEADAWDHISPTTGKTGVSPELDITPEDIIGRGES